MKTKLNIGCGWDKMEDFMNIDKAPEVKPDMVVNVEDGLPFKDNQFSYVYSCHALEHIRPEKWEFFLDELARVCKNNCVINLDLPFDNLKQRTDETHYRTFSWVSFRQLEIGIGSQRNYYSKLKLERLHPLPSVWVRAFFYFFPLLKNNINLRYRVVKDD